jgi:hypothetical protein
MNLGVANIVNLFFEESFTDILLQTSAPHER